jgi:CubicO group peptidase (beta-lactamase class C family)
MTTPWLAPDEPEAAGLSRPRLERLDAAFAAAVDRREIPGAVVVVARRGRIAWHSACGFLDREAGIAMPTDAIFRIASMTKPVVSLAAMMLVEEGALRLDLPVGAYLPVLKDMKVARVRSDGSLERAPPQRLPTVHDLLRHTSGMVNGHLGISPVKKLYAAAGVLARTELQSRDAFLAALAELPLEFEPGTTFAYGASTEVVGHIVEEICGMGLDAFVRTRITRPLGMTDTGFELPAADWQRVAQPQVDLATEKRRPVRENFGRPARFSALGNMVTSALDYARFCQLLLDRGVANGTRLVSRKTIEMMTANQLPRGCAFDPENAAAWGPALPSPDFGHGFGLGFSVQTEPGRAAWRGSVGAFTWAGGGGTYFWVDPQEELAAVLMMQTSPTEIIPFIYIVRSLVYGAIVD